MTTTVTLAMLQMTSQREVNKNLDYVDNALAKADLSSVDILVLPEMFIQFGEGDKALQVFESESFGGAIGARLRSWARKYQIWIVAGTVPVRPTEEDKPFARCVVLNDAGELVGHYDKIHLFDALVSDSFGQYRESDTYQPGSQAVVFDSPWGKIGLAVCYDLRFPELFRALNDQGAELVIVPSAFTAKTGAAHWEVLCRARAIENGSFIVAVNQCGQHDKKRSTWGHSMLVDPWGIVTDLGEQPVLESVTIELSAVELVRAQLPVNQHRRL